MAPSAPKSVLPVRLPAALREQIRALAEREQTSLNQMVVVLLAEGIGYRIGKGDLPQRTFTAPRPRPK
jgi:hypothetical protein